MEITVLDEEMTTALGRRLGQLLMGGEVIELAGDIGAGKTAFTRAIAAGLGIMEDVTSPSFTISRVYEVPDRDIYFSHYDFYRLDDPGIMASQLSEVVGSPKNIVVIEWGGVVESVLPNDVLRIRVSSTGESRRVFQFNASGERSRQLIEALQ